MSKRFLNIASPNTLFPRPHTGGRNTGLLQAPSCTSATAVGPISIHHFHGRQEVRRLKGEFETFCQCTSLCSKGVHLELMRRNICPTQRDIPWAPSSEIQLLNRGTWFISISRILSPAGSPACKSPGVLYPHRFCILPPEFAIVADSRVVRITVFCFVVE